MLTTPALASSATNPDASVTISHCVRVSAREDFRDFQNEPGGGGNGLGGKILCRRISRALWWCYTRETLPLHPLSTLCAAHDSIIFPLTTLRRAVPTIFLLYTFINVNILFLVPWRAGITLLYNIFVWCGGRVSRRRIRTMSIGCDRTVVQRPRWLRKGVTHQTWALETKIWYLTVIVVIHYTTSDSWPRSITFWNVYNRSNTH